MTDRVRAHVEAFNRAVESGDWERFPQRFGEDARLAFEGVPVGPFAGRDAKVLEIGEGTSEVQRMLIARGLGLPVE